ncbi:MAG: LysM peptidoglycan-binding domain-containing protein [Angustibacter sp.]
MPALTATLAATPLLLASGTGWSVHEVQEHDTLWDLARQHRTDVRTLVLANGLSDGGDLLRIGTTLRIPRVAAPGSGTPRHKSVRPRSVRYTVKAGDTVSELAVKFGISPSVIFSLNHLDRLGRIYVGKYLTLPEKAVRATAKSTRSTATGLKTSSYTIAPEDTLSGIARSVGAPLATLLKLNGLRMDSVIFAGQRLRVPHTSTSAPTSATTFAGRTYPQEVLDAAADHRTALARRSVPGPETTRRMVSETARRFGVNPALAMAIAYQESGFNQRQVSVANAIGTMQVIPSSGEWASELVGRRLNLLEISDNITAGVVILQALSRSADTLDQAIAGYYQGLGSVRRNGMFPDTKRYVANIHALTRRFT